MNDLAVQNQSGGLLISTETRDLIESGMADNTLNAYRRATQKLEA